MAAQLLHHFTLSGKITPSLLHHFLPLGSPTMTSLYPLLTNYPLSLITFYPPWQPNSCTILTSLEKLPPHSYTILPPLAARLLHHFTPSEQVTHALLHHFTPLGSSNLSSCYTLWTNYPLALTPFYHPWQPNYYIILPPLDKLPPHSYTILHLLAAQLWNLFTTSEQITPSLLHHIIPLGSPTIISFYPLWTNYTITLITFYPPWQPNSYTILLSLEKLPPHSYIILSPLAAQLLYHFTPSEQITPSVL